ncbi:hypothetical protein L210DRAFT_946016 [Boletus edulis BED1]|uniref:Uncharacterized protein n=1 Tax=Boletus edulis BED1 TaxID=1328754 RepID=A0AAD4BEH1_BOLED|nr:hypothetical protein L210DRAFT_946016 [Boletus edulis BED1]
MAAYHICGSADMKKQIISPVSKEARWATMNVVPQTIITAAHISSHQIAYSQPEKQSKE